MNAQEFTMADKSSKPYAWMFEAVSAQEIQSFGAKNWVRAYVRNTINATSDEYKASDETIYRVWRAGCEFEKIVEQAEEIIEEEMTKLPRLACEKFIRELPEMVVDAEEHGSAYREFSGERKGFSLEFAKYKTWELVYFDSKVTALIKEFKNADHLLAWLTRAQQLSSADLIDSVTIDSDKMATWTPNMLTWRKNDSADMTVWKPYTQEGKQDDIESE